MVRFLKDLEEEPLGGVGYTIGQGKGRGRFFAVPNRNRQPLLSIIMRHIKPGTTIMSDAWGAYKCLGGRGLRHSINDHKNGFTDGHTKHVCETFIVPPSNI